MTHDEFKTTWSKKHRTVFAALNRVLKANGLPGNVTGLTMAMPASLRTTEGSAGDCCDDPCKSPPCNSDEEIRICTCPDGSGGFRIHRCCVKKA